VELQPQEALGKTGGFFLLAAPFPHIHRSRHPHASPRHAGL